MGCCASSSAAERGAPPAADCSLLSSRAQDASTQTLEDKSPSKPIPRPPPVKRSLDQLAAKAVEHLIALVADIDGLGAHLDALTEGAHLTYVNTSSAVAMVSDIKVGLDTLRSSLPAPDVENPPAASSLKAARARLHEVRSPLAKLSSTILETTGYRFNFLSADVLRKWDGGPLPRHQEVQDVLGRDCMRKFSIGFKDVFATNASIGGIELTKFLAVSHRWLRAGAADPEGKQLHVLIEFLKKHPEIEWVWMDVWCLPQTPRTDVEDSHFREALDRIYMLFLGLPVLILLDFQYIGRFWTSYETFLSTRRVTVDGIGVGGSRCHIECMGGAGSSQEEMKKALLKTWGHTCTVDKAHSVLKSDDIVVTNQKDKDQQLEVLLRLNHAVPFMIGLLKETGAIQATQRRVCYRGDGLKATVSFPYSLGGWNWGMSVSPCDTYMLVGTNYPHSGSQQPFYRIDLETGSVTNPLSQPWHGRNPIGVAIAPSGKYFLATSTDGGSLAHVDLATGTVTFPYTGLHHPTGVAISPSGKLALADTKGSEVVKIDLETQKIVKKYGGFSCDHTGMGFAPDESYALIADTGRGTISRIDFGSDEVTMSVYTGFRRVKSVAIAPSGSFALVVDHDGQRIGHIDLGTGKISFPYGHCSKPWSVTFSHTGHCAFFSCGLGAGQWKIGRIDFE